MKSLEILVGTVIVFAVFGWGLNIYKFATSNFEPSYKNEVIRGIGIFIPPVGAITGYITIED